MELTEPWIAQWAEVAWPDAEDREDRIAGMRARIDDPGYRRRRRVRVADGRVAALTWLYDTEPGEIAFGALRTRGPAITVSDAVLVDEAVQTAFGEGALRVALRQPAERATPALLEAIGRTGGEERGGRVEFRAPLETLPAEGPSPLSWRPVDDEDHAAAMLTRVSVDAIDGLEDHDVPAEVIRSYLSDDELTTDPAGCLHIGAVDGEDVAFVCAQVEPKSGWSTVTFMGLVPEARGRGLGLAVQRHGLAMLRAQGGVEYHGGTSLTNLAMRACFARLGLPEWRRFREFRWKRRRRP